MLLYRLFFYYISYVALECSLKHLHYIHPLLSMLPFYIPLHYIRSAYGRQASNSFWIQIWFGNTYVLVTVGSSTWEMVATNLAWHEVYGFMYKIIVAFQDSCGVGIYITLLNVLHLAHPNCRPWFIPWQLNLYCLSWLNKLVVL